MSTLKRSTNSMECFVCKAKGEAAQSFRRVVLMTWCLTDFLGHFQDVHSPIFCCRRYHYSRKKSVHIAVAPHSNFVVHNPFVGSLCHRCLRAESAFSGSHSHTQSAPNTRNNNSTILGDIILYFVWHLILHEILS